MRQAKLQSITRTRSPLATICMAYYQAGRVAEAIPMFEEVLASREAMLGPDHPDRLASSDNLAAA